MRKDIHQFLFYSIICLQLFRATGSLAQEGKTISLTLAQAQEMALKQSPTLRISELQVDLAQNTTEERRQQRLPQVYGDMNLQRNLILPTTPVPAKAFDPTATEDELIHLRFTTKWTANTGINASVDLFNPERSGSVKRAALEAGLSASDLLFIKNQLLFDVGNAFYACLIAEEQLRLAENDTLTRKEILQMHQRQFEKGRITRSEINLAKTELNNGRILLNETRMIYENAKSELLRLIGMATDKPVSLQLIDSDLVVVNEISVLNETETQSIRLSRLRQEQAINLLDVRIAHRSFLPLISLNGYYGANYFDNRFDVFKGANWYGNSFINLGIRIPLSENLFRSKELAKLKIQEDILSEQVRAAANERTQNLQEAFRELRYQEFQFLKRKENLDMAEENARISSLQYEKGRMLVGDYYQQLYLLQKERAAYLESKYKLLISKLSLEKVKSN